MLLNFNTPACERLIRGAFTQDELPSLIEAIFSGKDEGDAVHRLAGDDAQTVIDLIHEVRSRFARHLEFVD